MINREKFKNAYAFITCISMLAFNLDATAQISDFASRFKIHINTSEVYGNADLTNLPFLVHFKHPDLRNASLVNYENALRTVTYRNLKVATTKKIKTIAFGVVDGDNFSNTQSRNVEVVKVNILPELADVEETSMLHFPDFGQAAITNNLTITDLDLIVLIGGTIEISSVFVQSVGQLSNVDKNGIVGSWNSTNGILTLSESASTGNEQGTSNTFDVTPSAVSETTSTISANPTVIIYDGFYSYIFI